MNKKMILYVLGKLLLVCGALLVLPLIISVIYKENTYMSFIIPIGMLFILGTLLCLKKPKNNNFYAREGFIIVGLSWILISFFGSLPFVISGEIPSMIDAFFETVSGFTTTGSSILENVEELSYGMLFWRSFTHWIGGMGILVFVLIFLPSDGRSLYILKAESPGPQVGKLVSKVKFTARILYLIYLLMTLTEIIFLLFDMPVFDAVVNSFATAGTGGFAIKSASIGAYSDYSQIVIGVFMLLFGINFNFFFLILIKNFKKAFKMEEVFWYLGIILVSTILIAVNIYFTIGGSLAIILKDSFFQVSSIITTTGFATTDFNLWPALSQVILVLLMFIGACAGSTGGGMKVSRFVLIVKSIRRNIKKLVHPKSISNIRFEGGVVDDDVVHGALNYFACLIFIFIFCLIIIAFDNKDFVTNFTAVSACINNIGPGLGEVGPMGNYNDYSDLSKIILSMAMLVGRLEIFPILMLFSPKIWLNK